MPAWVVMKVGENKKADEVSSADGCDGLGGYMLSSWQSMSTHNKVLINIVIPHRINKSEAQSGAFAPITQSQRTSPIIKLMTAIQPQTVLSFIGVTLYSAIMMFN